jgi:MFS family permease
MTTSTPLTSESLTQKRWWWQYLNRYHWFVLAVCALGWMFDCADQQIFTASRSIAMSDLVAFKPASYQGSIDAYRNYIGSWATTLFMVGWASGGLLFGTIGDKWGRAKTMALTIFLYATCTGLSALAHNWQEFALSRLITGFGVGGEFAAGASLVADVMPQRARAQALGLLQALSAVGNIIGAGMLWVASSLAHGEEHWKWRYLYWFGALPALVAVVVMFRLKEPETWVEAKRVAATSGGRKMGRIGDLFSDPRWRRNTLVGLALAISGVIGLWSISFYSPELIDSSFPKMSHETGRRIEAALDVEADAPRAAMVAGFNVEEKKAYANLLSRTVSRGEQVPDNVSAVRITPARKGKMTELLSHQMPKEQIDALKSKALILQQIGAFVGMIGFSMLATRIGRRWTFAISFLAAWVSIYIVFLGFHRPEQIWYLYPLLGVCTLLPFGGYAVYFPELFPTRLRTTGTGFCYNVGRYVASLGPLAFASVAGMLVGHFDTPAFRVAALIVSSVYIVGIVAAFCGPETMDQPLPEDQRVAAH